MSLKYAIPLNSQQPSNINPKESFAWKDKTLDTELKALREARYEFYVICQVTFN